MHNEIEAHQFQEQISQSYFILFFLNFKIIIFFWSTHKKEIIETKRMMKTKVSEQTTKTRQ